MAWIVDLIQAGSHRISCGDTRLGTIDTELLNPPDT